MLSFLPPEITAAGSTILLRRFKLYHYQLDSPYYDATLHTIFEWLLSKAGESRGGTALNYFAYTFIKIHRTLRMRSAMAAGAFILLSWAKKPK